MRIPRIHVAGPLLPGREIELPAQAGEHLVRVLRLEQGAPLRLFDGNGSEHEAELASIVKRTVTARVKEAIAANDRESPLRITLGQGIARGEKMDWILQKATELGVARIVPIVTDRTEVKLDAERAERRVAHWEAVVASACEQCGRSRLPEVGEPVKLADWAASLDESAGLASLSIPRAISHRAIFPRARTRRSQSVPRADSPRTTSRRSAPPGFAAFGSARASCAPRRQASPRSRRCRH
jgi:16S rRNA (uracil1498-N3)-methyltransferase